MRKTKKIEDLKISDFPEVVDEANGVRITMQYMGGKCVYSSEFDAKAQKSINNLYHLVSLQIYNKI